MFSQPEWRTLALPCTTLLLYSFLWQLLQRPERPEMMWPAAAAVFGDLTPLNALSPSPSLSTIDSLSVRTERGATSEEVLKGRNNRALRGSEEEREREGSVRWLWWTWAQHMYDHHMSGHMELASTRMMQKYEKGGVSPDVCKFLPRSKYDDHAR